MSLMAHRAASGGNGACWTLPGMSSRSWTRQPGAACRYAAASKALPDAAAGGKVLEQQPRPPSPEAVAAAAAVRQLQRPAAGALTAEAPSSQWERVYVSTSSGSSAFDAADRPPVPLAARPKRRTTAAPGTAVGQAAADPRLVRLTQQLIACRGPGEMRAVLGRGREGVGEPLEAADVRRLLTYLDRQGATDVALAAFHAVKAMQPLWADDGVLRTKLIKMHSRRPRDTPTALALYDEMRSDGVVPDAVCYNICLAAAGLGQHWGRVLSILEDMQAAGVPWDAFTCSALLSACQASGRWEQALAWFRAAQDVPGLQLNVVHYTTLMSCLQRAGQWEQSIRVFREMEAAGVAADVVAHNAAIAACAKGGDWEKAWAVFLAMKQAGLRPSTISYNALISACERCGQTDRALEVFASMQRQPQASPNAVTYNTLISACAKAGLYAKAQQLHGQMQAAGVPDDVFTLTALITACERIGHWQGAEDHFLEFQTRGITPNTVAFNRLISALGRGGQWEQALAAFQAMQPSSSSSGSGSGGSGGRSRSRRTASAADGSRADGASSSSSSRSGDGAPPPVEAAAAAGDGGSGAVVSSVPDTSVVSASSSLYAMAAAQGRGPVARPDRITYGSLISALERGGQWERALALLEEMQAAGMQPNGYIFTSLINACEKGGQWEQAVELFRLMQQRQQDIPLDSMAMVARKALYAFPSLIKVMPAPLLQAARATVDSGRAARQWIEQSKSRKEA